MTSLGGTKRGRDAIANSERSLLRLPVTPSTTDKKSDQEQRKREERIRISPSTIDLLSISKHSQRNRKKRIKLSRLRDNRQILMAAAAMEEQLASFEKVQNQPDFTSTSFSASSSFFDTSCSQQDESNKTDLSETNTNKCSASEEYELAALARRSLRLDELSPSSSSRKPKHRRRGAISIVIPRR